MTQSLALIPILTAGFILVGCGAHSQAPNVLAVQQALDSMHVEHSEAYVRKDLDAIMAVYTDDPVIRSNHVEPLRGRAALRDFIGGWFAVMDFERLDYAIDELAVHGDSAYAIGTFDATVRPHRGEPVIDRGSYMVLYIRDPEGTWRSHRGVFNSSIPLPTPATD